MNRFLKFTLIFLAILTGIIISIIIAWNISSYYNAKRAEKDSVLFAKHCESVTVISDPPSITFIDFKRNEIDQLKFQILRDKKLINDTFIKNNFEEAFINHNSEEDFISGVQIPYKEFYTTDTIVLTTRNGLKFYVSGYHHIANLHYGMLGYVGGYDCRLAKDCIINGNPTAGIISGK